MEFSPLSSELGKIEDYLLHSAVDLDSVMQKSELSRRRLKNIIREDVEFSAVDAGTEKVIRELEKDLNGDSVVLLSGAMSYFRRKIREHSSQEEYKMHNDFLQTLIHEVVRHWYATEATEDEKALVEGHAGNQDPEEFLIEYLYNKRAAAIPDFLPVKMEQTVRKPEQADHIVESILSQPFDPISFDEKAGEFLETYDGMYANEKIADDLAAVGNDMSDAFNGRVITVREAALWLRNKVPANHIRRARYEVALSEMFRMAAGEWLKTASDADRKLVPNINSELDDPIYAVVELLNTHITQAKARN